MKVDCLIVDDEEMLSKNTHKYFSMNGLKTEWVADWESCVDFFRDNQADLILLDINLGDSSGFDLCGYLRETTNVPILFISARTSDDDVLLALNVGGDDYIQKPYSLAVLLAKVNAVLKRYQAPKPEANTLAMDKLTIDFAAERAFLGGQEIGYSDLLEQFYILRKTAAALFPRMNCSKTCGRIRLRGITP